MKRRRHQPARDRARSWLQSALACGPVAVDALRWQAHKKGIAWRTLQRARAGIANAQKIGFGRGHWVWMKSATSESEARQQRGRCPVCGAERGGADL